MSADPLVSICIPTYNRAGMIGKAIESALGQSYRNIEVIVVDNASEDNTAEVVASYADERLRYVKNERNLGLFGNFNRCIELATGKYLYILHSDDCIDPEFTAISVKFLEAHPDVAMTFGSIHPANECAEPKKKSLTPPVIYDIPDGFRKILENRSFISCPTVTIRRDVYDSIGFYSLEYPYSGDLYQWLRIAQRFRIASVPDAHLYYHTGPHSESYHLLFKTPIGYIDTLKIYVRITDELGVETGVYSRELNCAYRRHMRDCLFAGITRSDSMKNYSRLIFIGLAMSVWSLISPVSLMDTLKKCSEFLLIFLIGCAIVLPGGRYCVRKLFGFSPDKY
jgi:glycosyltransferase involved in cell wall biosynthesis